LNTLKSDFGLERGEFTVYAPREELIGVVKPMKGSYIQVKIQPVFKEIIDFVSRRSSSDQNLAKSKKLIVGVDPGTTCGVAILTFDGEPLYLDSRKGLTRAEIIDLLIKFGETVLVAADVSPAPQFVEKLAKSVDATLFTPEATLEVAEKQELALAYSKRFKVEVKDTHERDALAAAIKALQQFKNKFEQAEARIGELGVQVPMDEVKALIVKGYSIQRAIELLLPKQEEAEKPVEERLLIESSREMPKLIEQLRKKISIQGRQIERLRAQNEQLTCQIKSLQTSLLEAQSMLEKARAEPVVAIRREREYQNLQREIENLRKQIASLNAEVLQYRQRLEALRRMKELESRGEAVLLKPVEAFTKTGLEKAFQLYEIKRDDIVLFLDASGGGASTAEILAKRGVKAIITCTAMSHQAEEKFKNYRIPILPIENIQVEWVEGYPYAKIGEIESALRKLTEAEKADAEQKLKKLIEDYRKERLSGI
jgi:predicted RNase H-like nuclease (RuvC/YqgF family)